jgi:type IV secretory pathway VirB2 component (pilin)
MMDFRGAYVAFATDPCGNGNMLNRHVKNILREQHRFQLVRVQIRALVALATTGSNHLKVMETFQRIVDQIGGPIAEAAVDEIAASTEAMRKWIGGPK